MPVQLRPKFLFKNGSDIGAGSPFVSDALFEHAPTYIYHAAIRSNDTYMIVGGIRIVFDSTPELSAKLKDSIPEKSSFSVFYIN